MGETAQIVSIEEYRSRNRTEGAGSDTPPLVRMTPDTLEPEPARVGKRQTNLEDLYSADVKSTKLITRARELLHNIDQRAATAHDALKVGDEIGADQQVMLLGADLPELFCCRTISEGLATFVLALHYALHNQRGIPLNLDQVYALRKGLQRLHSDIFLSFSESLDLVDNLINCGMIVDPPEAMVLDDVFINES